LSIIVIIVIIIMGNNHDDAAVIHQAQQATTFADLTTPSTATSTAAPEGPIASRSAGPDDASSRDGTSSSSDFDEAEGREKVVSLDEEDEEETSVSVDEHTEENSDDDWQEGDAGSSFGGVGPHSPIAIIERNLAHIIRQQHGGRLNSSVWREKYIAEYGESALSAHWKATRCTKFKNLIKKMTTVVRGTGPNSNLLYYRPAASSPPPPQAAALSPAQALLEFEDNLMLLIQGRRGKLPATVVSSDYRDAYGHHALGLSLKICGCNSVKAAIRKMARINYVIGNNGNNNYYVLTDPSLAITVPTKPATTTTTMPTPVVKKSVPQKPNTAIVPVPVNHKPATTATKKAVHIPAVPQKPQTSIMVEQQHKKPTTTTTTGGASVSSTGGGIFVMIDTLPKLHNWRDQFLDTYLAPLSLRGNHNNDDAVHRSAAVAISCRGVPQQSLDVIAMAFFGEENATFVFDLVKIDVQAVVEIWRPLLANPSICKLFHDLHEDVAALSNIGGLATWGGLMDTQLVAEHLHRDLWHCDFYAMLDGLEINIPATTRLKKKYIPKAELFARRPITVDVISPVIDMVQFLASSYCAICDRFDDKTWTALLAASDLRATAASIRGASSAVSRRVGFDVTRGYAMASYELLCALYPQHMMNEQPLEVVHDIATLLNIFPNDMRDALVALDSTHLSDIVMDKGRRPHAWVADERMMLLGPDRLVGQEEIEELAERFRFGSDNRAGLERQLHRISAVRNREAMVIGVTIRVGRHVSGNAGIIADVLFQSPNASILFLGEPGSGKRIDLFLDCPFSHATITIDNQGKPPLCGK
jgi:hypothetical protein